MRIAFTSDLHLDFFLTPTDEALSALVREVRRSKPDVFVFAGDLAIHTRLFEQGLAAFQQVDCPALLIPGNHCLRIHAEERSWIGDSQNKYEVVLPELCESYDVTPLWMRPLSLGGVSFVGSYGHYDYTYAPPGSLTEEFRQTKRFGSIQFDDHIYQNWPQFQGRSSDGSLFTEDEALTQWMLEGLETQLRSVPKDEPRVAVVHSVPFRKGVLYRGNPEWDVFCAVMGSEKAGDVLLRNEVHLALFGHTHYPHDFEVGGIRALCSPVGRQSKPDEWPSSLSVEEKIRQAVRVVEIAPR